jgi:hypothetical protein
VVRSTTLPRLYPLPTPIERPPISTVWIMATYSREDFERIAAAIGRDVGDVVKHKQLFEWAADWYGLDCGLPRDAPPRPRPTPPSKMREKLQRIAKSARRLLQDLKITT